MILEKLFTIFLVLAASGYAYDYARNKKPLSAGLAVFCSLAALT